MTTWPLVVVFPLELLGWKFLPDSGLQSYYEGVVESGKEQADSSTFSAHHILGMSVTESKID